MASSFASTSTLPPTQDEIDIERILNQESSLLNREEEVSKVISSCKRPY